MPIDPHTIKCMEKHRRCMVDIGLDPMALCPPERFDEVREATPRETQHARMDAQVDGNDILRLVMFCPESPLPKQKLGRKCGCGNGTGR